MDTNNLAKKLVEIAGNKKWAYTVSRAHDTPQNYIFVRIHIDGIDKDFVVTMDIESMLFISSDISTSPNRFPFGLTAEGALINAIQKAFQ